ncbi:hypothetical protein [Comamonas sp.]|uniref:hypothetical protein n=1 Tax=Comamonas sp. TaxID=34028 RepID=UPI0025C03B5C|nr:hypothetical protein [Comamonas sp.]
MSENKSPVERLRLALANREEEKQREAQQCESEALQAAELAELYKQLETLPRQERRRILVQAGIKLTTEAPPPITPLRGGRMFASANTEITRDDLSAPGGRSGMPLEMKKIIWPAKKIAIPVSDLHCLLADAVTRNPPPHPDEDDEEWAIYELELGLNLVRYESSINAAITRGELPIRDPITGERLPSYVNAQHAVVSMKDLEEYLKRSGSFVELSIEPESVSAESRPTPLSMTARIWCGDEEKAPPDWTDEEIEAARAEVEAIQVAERRGKAETQDWVVKRPKRFSPYSAPLYKLLYNEWQKGRLRRPTPRDVLDEWSTSKPAEIFEVMQDGLKYYASNGDVKTVDLAALREAIARMTERHV